MFSLGFGLEATSQRLQIRQKREELCRKNRSAVKSVHQIYARIQLKQLWQVESRLTCFENDHGIKKRNTELWARIERSKSNSKKMHDAVHGTVNESDPGFRKTDVKTWRRRE